MLFLTISYLTFVDEKLKKEPVAETLIGCVFDETNIKSVKGYWERFEICNSETWFMSFYILQPFEYFALKRKCPTGTFVQPVSMNNRNIHNAIRLDKINSFEPAILNLYYKRKLAYRINIKNRWKLKDLYQLCNTSTLQFFR